jgi:F420-0:gamma-glutamyl ligase
MKKARPKITVQAIPTEIFHAGNSLEAFLETHLKGLDLEGRVLVITSKLISLAENQVVPRTGIDKRALVQREADLYLGEGGFGVELTIKHGLLLPSAGIDESNSEEGGYLLFPADPYASAKRIWQSLRQKFGLKNFGLILSDSHSTPLRRGVTGIGLAHFGFKATRSLVGRRDLFDHPLKFTHVNVVDSLAVMAVFAMGEADEGMPLAVVEEAELEFTEESNASEVTIAPENDLYYPLLEPRLKFEK